MVYILNATLLLAMRAVPRMAAGCQFPYGPEFQQKVWLMGPPSLAISPRFPLAPVQHKGKLIQLPTLAVSR